MKTAAVVLALCFSALVQGQAVIGSGAIISPGMTTGTGGAAPAGVSFSPAGGPYGTTQNVTITGPLGTNCFYTLDGSTPNIASTHYTTPIAVTSGTTVIKAICAQTPVVYQNVQTTSPHWKCVVAAGTTYPSGLTCETGGGVTGTLSDASMGFGAPASFSASTTSGAGENQILYVNTQPGCGGLCTMLAEDKVFQAGGDSTKIANNELDMNMNDASRSRYHAGGLQCNQQAGHVQWQVDNQQGSWQNTGITFGCPISTTQRTTARYTMHWTNGDTGCGGFGCDSYDTLTVCVGSTCNDYALGITLEAYTEPWSDSTIIQDQIDLTNIAVGGNPTTGSRTIYQANISGGIYGTTVTGTSTYIIP